MDDYLHITLTDEQDIPEALARLRVIYPNLMRLDYDNRRTQTDRSWMPLQRPNRKHRWSTLQIFTSCRTTSP